MLLPVQSVDNLATHLKLYKRRWFMLCLFGFLTFSNSLLFGTFPPISLACAKFYHTSLANINFLSLIFYLAYLPLFFPAAWLLDNKGLWKTVGNFIDLSHLNQLCGGWLVSVAGGWLRMLLWKNFIGVLFGQLLAAIGQVFIVGATTKVAEGTDY